MGDCNGDLPAEMFRDPCDLFDLNSRMNTGRIDTQSQGQ